MFIYICDALFYMKLPFSILLILIILFNTAGNIILFNIKKKQIKSDIVRIIKSEQNPSNLEKISLTTTEYSNLRFTDKNKKEFRFEGKMYDVVFYSKNEDIVQLYCINDEKEESLISKFCDSVSNLSEKRNQLHKTLQLFEKILTFEYFIEKPARFIRVWVYSMLNNSDVQLLSSYSDVKSPPPKNCQYL